MTPHPVHLAINAAPDARKAAYRASFETSISDDDMAAIRAHVQQQKALSDPRFQAQVEALLVRNVSVRPRGRPKRPSQDFERTASEQPSLLR